MKLNAVLEAGDNKKLLGIQQALIDQLSDEWNITVRDGKIAITNDKLNGEVMLDDALNLIPFHIIDSTQCSRRVEEAEDDMLGMMNDSGLPVKNLVIELDVDGIPAEEYGEDSDDEDGDEDLEFHNVTLVFENVDDAVKAIIEMHAHRRHGKFSLGVEDLEPEDLDDFVEDLRKLTKAA